MVFLTAGSSRSVCTTVLTVKVLYLDEKEVPYTFPIDPTSYVKIMGEKYIYFNKGAIKTRYGYNFRLFFFNLERTGQY